MGITRFPRGVSSFGIPVLGNDGIVPTASGNYYWVDSNSTATALANGDFDTPYTTLMAAYGACTTNNDDVIIIKAGHAETFATNSVATLNKAGVSIVGLGRGARKPTFTLTGTTAAVTIAISGASQLLRNVILTSGVAELAAAITVSAANVTLDGVEYRESSATFTVLSVVTGTNAADFLTITNCLFRNTTISAGASGCITGVAGMNDVTIANNILEWIGKNDAATCAIYNAGAGLRWVIANNIFKITGGTSVTCINATTCTGIQVNTRGAIHNGGTITAANQFDLGFSVECYFTETVDTNGILDPIGT